MQGLFLFKEVLTRVEYSGLKTAGLKFSAMNKQATTDSDGAKECKLIKETFFHNQRVTELVNIIIKQLCILSPIEIQKMMDDPCLFYHENTIVGAKDDVRGAAKDLFEKLGSTHKNILMPIVAQLYIEALQVI